jgi:Family of unknown function (DUF6496)
VNDPLYNEVELSSMPRLSKRASKKAKRSRMKTEMGKFKEGKLHSGSKAGRVVKSRAQAIAIGLSESGQSRKNRKKKAYTKR